MTDELRDKVARAMYENQPPIIADTPWEHMPRHRRRVFLDAAEVAIPLCMKHAAEIAAGLKAPITDDYTGGYQIAVDAIAKHLRALADPSRDGGR